MDSQNYNNPQNNQQQYDQYAQSQYDPQLNGQPQYDPNFNPVAPAAPKPSGMSIASLVLGIVGIVVGCCSGLFGLIIGIIGLVLGICGNNKVKTGLGTAGVILSAIAIGWSIISWIIGIVFLQGLSNDYSNFF